MPSVTVSCRLCLHQCAFLSNAFLKRLIQRPVIFPLTILHGHCQPSPAGTWQTRWQRRQEGAWAQSRGAQMWYCESDVQLAGQSFIVHEIKLFREQNATNHLQRTCFKILLRTMIGRGKECSGHDRWWFNFHKSEGVRTCCGLKMMTSSGAVGGATDAGSRVWGWGGTPSWPENTEFGYSYIVLLARLITPVFISEMSCPLRMKNLLLILSQKWDTK